MEIGEDLKPYLYSISFKGRQVNDMLAEGYLKAAEAKLTSMESDLVFYGPVVPNDPESVVTAIVKVRAEYDGKVYEAFGEAVCPIEVDMARLARYAETRGMKRALARACGIYKRDLNRSVEDYDIEEDGVTAKKNYDDGFPNSKSIGSGNKNSARSPKPRSSPPSGGGW